MNLHGSVELEWSGGEHTFRLALKEIEALEADTGKSVFELFHVMSAMPPVAKLKDYSATIAWGLIGGGMTPTEARALVRRWVDERPLVESVAVALVVLRAAIERVHTEKEQPTGEAQTPSQPGGLTSGSSTETPPSSE